LHDALPITSMWQRLVPPLHRSRGIVWRLTALFSVDALAGGLVVQSLMALFFHLRFGVSLTTLSALFFGANLLSALSFLAAVPLARRFGLLLQGPLLVLGLPFILAGMLKSAYDCSLWMVFRHVHLEEEQRAPTPEPARPGEVSHAPKDGARTQTDDGRSRQR